MAEENDLPTIECERGQSALEAAALAEYKPPRFRVGQTTEASARPGEIKIALVKVGRHSRPLPIFDGGAEIGVEGG